MKIIKLQPRKQLDGTVPRPFFVYKDGRISEQDFWKGNPLELLGFSKEPVAGEMQLNVRDLFFHPTQAIGLYPVFKTKKGKWFTSKDAIGKFEVIKKKGKNDKN